MYIIFSVSRGDISQPRFKRALEKRRRDPDRFVNNLIKKRRLEEGRCEVTMRNIPENWDDLKVQNVLKAYGELKGFG